LPYLALFLETPNHLAMANNYFTLTLFCLIFGTAMHCPMNEFVTNLVANAGSFVAPLSVP